MIATAAMDLLWYRRYRSGGGDAALGEWEFTSGATSFGDDAPAPARVGKFVADRVGVELPDTSVAATNNAVHWATGIGWGKFAGVAAGLAPVPAFGVGVVTGVTAWATSYAVLPLIGVYEPITHYDRETLWKDLSAHLVFGATLGLALTVLKGPTTSRRRRAHR
jgi:hypothetical protein